MLCFLNKSSVVKNLDLSSVLPVDPVTYIMTNITFFWLKSAFIARHETRNFKLPWDIFGDYGNAETWVICFRWMLWYDAGANIKISHAGNACQFHARHAAHAKPKWFHDRHTRHAKPDEQKTGNETSARREFWDQSLATILEKIKWNSKSPSPQIKDEGARRAKTRHSPILDLGGRGGSMFSIYFVQDCRSVFGGEGMNSFFPCLWDVIYKYQWSL